MKHQYICKNCGNHITFPNGAKYCPICSGELKSKAEIYAKEKIQELQELLPVLEKKYNEFAELYVKFKITNETLRTYAARGLIDKESVPEFKPETLTDIFYRSRKKRK